MENNEPDVELLEKILQTELNKSIEQNKNETL
jgi:hypothetical protein